MPACAGRAGGSCAGLWGIFDEGIGTGAHRCYAGDAKRRARVDLNLESLKSEIGAYLESSDFAIFRGHPGGLEDWKLISWDSERWPDYRGFLDAARKVGEKMIMFASREMTGEEVDEALEELTDSEFTREERRDLEKKLRAAQRHLGETCSLELAFTHGAHIYVYEARPDWYDDFIDACEEINSIFPAEDDSQDAGNDGLGGYFSNN